MPQKQKPDNIHLLQGTYRKDRHGEPDKKPRVRSEIPDAPEFLTDEARKEWDYTVEKLEKAGLLTGADKVILSQFCMLAAEFARDGYDFNAAKHTQLRMCQIELGMTPSARSKITVKDDDGEDF